MVLTTFDPFAQFDRQFNRLAQRGGAAMPMDGRRLLLLSAPAVPWFGERSRMARLALTVPGR